MRHALTFDGVPVGFVDLVGVPPAAGSVFTLSAFEGCGLRAPLDGSASRCASSAGSTCATGQLIPIVVAVLRHQADSAGAEPTRWAAGPGEVS